MDYLFVSGAGPTKLYDQYHYIASGATEEEARQVLQAHFDEEAAGEDYEPDTHEDYDVYVRAETLEVVVSPARVTVRV